MSSQTELLSSGGVAKIEGSTWRTVATLIYPGTEVAAKGQEVKKAWVTAQCGDTSIGLDLVLEDNMGNAIAGPSTTYGGGVQQIMALMPLRASRLRTRGNSPQVLILRARNRSSPSQASFVGQVSLELGPITQ